MPEQSPESSTQKVSRERLSRFLNAETARFYADQSREVAGSVSRLNDRSMAGMFHASSGLTPGWFKNVPLHWMLDWPVKPSMQRAQGATLWDEQGRAFNDFCLGDSAALFGHAPVEVINAVAEQMTQGITTLLPSVKAARVGELLVDRFKLPYWQMSLTASDANRFALKLARAVTGRSKVLVFEGCYHGALDEALVYGDPHRNVHPRPGVLGADANVDQRTRVVPFNDLNALEAALSDHQVACVLAEPVMTNCGMIEPLPGFWDTARALTHHTQTLLLLDETHTLASGLGGYAARFSWQADMIVMGKSIAGGIPAAVWGFSEAIAVQFEQLLKTKPAGHSGIGTTLSGNAVGIAAMQAVLETCMTDAAYTHMLTLAKMLEHELMQLIHRKSLHMSVSRCGARLELIFTQQAPRNALEMNAVQDEMLERALHIGLMNRGQILTPFHNMMLICPYTQEAQVRALVSAFDEVFTELLAA